MKFIIGKKYRWMEWDIDHYIIPLIITRTFVYAYRPKDWIITPTTPSIRQFYIAFESESINDGWIKHGWMEYEPE
jgi:hypothetical protein